MTTLVISPHLDDAVFSLGGWIAGESDVIVATVFAGVPAEGVDPITEGFASGAQEVEARRAEDLVACHAVGASAVQGPFLDGPYNGHAEIDESDVARWIVSLERVFDVSVLVRPVGVRHPQHVATARAAALSHRPGVTRLVYAELPYSVLWPELVPEVAGLPVDLEQDEARAAWKQAACARYVSQYPGTDRDALRSPERLWRLP